MHTITHPAILKAKQDAKAQNKMSITQTFYLAHSARGKLASEAAKQDHNLRFLVGHANLLDRLMLHLNQAEQEQDAWFNDMVSGNIEAEEPPMKTWETIPEESEDSSDDESASDEEDFEMEDDFTLFPVLTATSSIKPDTRVYVDTIDVDDLEDTEDEDSSDEDGLYELVRTSSHRPPSLVSDHSDSDEDDEYTPPSPPQLPLAQPVLSEKQRQQLVTTSYYEEPSSEQIPKDSFYHLHPQSNMISAY